MNKIDIAKKAAFDIWIKSDKTTKLSFSDETGFKGRNAYNRLEHTVYICPKTLLKQFVTFDIPDLTFEDFVKYVVAHELAHSVEKEPEVFPVNIGTIISLQDSELIAKYRTFALRTKFKQEALAWKNSRKFLDVRNKETFYQLVRICLDSYKDYEDPHFEEALIAQQNSLKEMFASLVLNL